MSWLPLLVHEGGGGGVGQGGLLPGLKLVMGIFGGEGAGRAPSPHHRGSISAGESC